MLAFSRRFKSLSTKIPKNKFLYYLIFKDPTIFVGLTFTPTKTVGVIFPSLTPFSLSTIAPPRDDIASF